MNIQEWALIAFTILAQMSVGSFVVLGIVHLYARKRTGQLEADRLSDRALLAIGPVLFLAFVASLFHLGTPFNAFRAVTNLGSSWLSREIFFGVLFALAGALFAFMQWRKIGTPTVRQIVAIIAALIGVAMVLSMSFVYLLPTQPAWNTLLTPLSFLVTTALLGLFAIGAALVVNYNIVRTSDPECEAVQCELLRANLRGIAVAGVLLVGVELIALPIYLGTLLTGTDAALQTAQLYVVDYVPVLLVRVTLAFLGAAVLSFFLYQNATSPGKEQVASRLAVGAFALVLLAEVVGRFLFYATHVGVGV